MVDQNLTFDDGEPLDISKLQKLYGIILDVQAKSDSATSLYNQSIKQIPQVYANTTGEVSVTNKLTKVATLDYSAMGLEASVKPRISITPRGTSDGIANVKYFAKNVASGSADLMAITSDKDGVKAYFDFIVVYMKSITA
jgi:hypothetical protein